MAGGSRVLAHGIGIVNLFPFLSINNVLYIPWSPFNFLSISCLTHSLDCVISFTKDFVCLHNQSSRWVIDTECETHSLYHLYPSTHRLYIFFMFS